MTAAAWQVGVRNRYLRSVVEDGDISRTHAHNVTPQSPRKWTASRTRINLKVRRTKRLFYRRGHTPLSRSRDPQKARMVPMRALLEAGGHGAKTEEDADERVMGLSSASMSSTSVVDLLEVADASLREQALSVLGSLKPRTPLAASWSQIVSTRGEIAQEAYSSDAMSDISLWSRARLSSVLPPSRLPLS
ncbi:hypothetical protein BC628DRAFT_740942 [Trametes gibbosa]|nr:hypothetical protein BC628DRAFT_740942 [Trametes gibbosa]